MVYFCREDTGQLKQSLIESTTSQGGIEDNIDQSFFITYEAAQK